MSLGMCAPIACTFSGTGVRFSCSRGLRPNHASVACDSSPHSSEDLISCCDGLASVLRDALRGSMPLSAVDRVTGVRIALLAELCLYAPMRQDRDKEHGGSE